MTETYPSCICCGGTQFKRTPSLIPDFQLIHCGHCRSAFTWPQLSAADLEKYYLQSYYGPENVKFVSPLERIVEQVNARRAGWINRHLSPASRVLEIGCGRGLLLAALQKKGHQCAGIERSALAAARAREIPGLQIFTAPLAECLFSENTFDLVVLWHVLEHLTDPAGTLATIYRLLRPGGRLILEVPNLAGWQSRLSGRYWFHLDVERHLYHFTPEGMTLLLRRQGFLSRTDGTFSWEQSPYGALQSLLNCLLSPPEALYKLLKREVRFSLPRSAGHLGLATLLFFPSLLLAVVESWFNRGAVLRTVAVKPPAGD